MMKKYILHLCWSAAAVVSASCFAPPLPGGDVKSAVDVGEGPAFETEKMGRFGGNDLRAQGTSGAGIEGPFQGVVLYGNGDHVRVDYNFASPGRYAFQIKGASSDGAMAGVTVFVGEQGGTTVFFEDREGEPQIAYAEVETAGLQTIKLQLTTDVGQNDTYLDAFVVSRKGDVSGAPVPPSEGAFKTGVYRNMFVERGYEADTVTRRVNAAYEQLFHGDPNEQALMYSAGVNENGPLAQVRDIGNGDVRSESMSYGMMIALQMDRQADFNAMWNWSKTYMYQKNPAHPCYGYFAWQMTKDGKAMDEMPAPDGEEYFIMSLFFASNRWGDGEGIYNYKQEALNLLDKFKNRPEIKGTSKNAWGTREITGTALMNPEHKMVRFTPDMDNFAINGDHTDPSYHLPAFYELWALWGPEKDKAFWQEAAKASRDFFNKAAHKETGLTPDYSNFDGTPVSASFNKGSDTFRWDAWRTAMNWAMDYHWWAADPREKELTDRIQTFFAGQGMYSYRGCYTLSGRPAEGENGKWHSVGLVATNGASSLAATHRRAWQFVDAVWGAAVPTGLYRYYDGILLMFSMLHLSGNFQIYLPGHAEKIAAEKAALEKAQTPADPIPVTPSETPDASAAAPATPAPATPVPEVQSADMKTPAAAK